jgi:hypothetical protein
MSNEERIIQWTKIGLGLVAIIMFAYYMAQ